VEAKLQGVWDKDVPPSIEATIAQAQASLSAALEAGEKLLRVDIRTPGLDEALEQTAIREKSMLLSVVGTFFPLFANVKKTKVLFESEVRRRLAGIAVHYTTRCRNSAHSSSSHFLHQQGEAALAAKAFSQGAWDIPEVCFHDHTYHAEPPGSIDQPTHTISRGRTMTERHLRGADFTGRGPRRRRRLLRGAHQPLGQPGHPDGAWFLFRPCLGVSYGKWIGHAWHATQQTKQVEELVMKHPGKTFILFNPDLEMRGSPTGIRERDRRQRFLDSFKSAYIYLCLVRARVHACYHS